MEGESIYDEIGVSTVINGAGTKTRISGSLMRPGAADAMRRASEKFVRISDLQAAASDRIAEVTGAEAGYVSSGASAGLTLAAAACIAGTDLRAMDRLPVTDDVPSEIVVPRTHRNGYDHALRAAGAEIVDVGGNDHHLGTGAENTELWEIDSAIGEETAAVGYMEKPYSNPPLENVVDVAHDNDVPVIVDAAAELPPVENFERFVDAGADLVVFSGGKAVRGPQTTGIVAGKQQYVESIALQQLDMHTDRSVWDPPSSLIDVDSLDGVPRHGIGRGLKVGKEELVGLIYALEEFVETDHEAERNEWRNRAERIATSLESLDSVTISLDPGGKTNRAATVSVTLDGSAELSSRNVVRELRAESPRVFVGTDYLDENRITINPMCLTDEESEHLVNRIKAYLG